MICSHILFLTVLTFNVKDGDKSNKQTVKKISKKCEKGVKSSFFMIKKKGQSTNSFSCVGIG